MTGTDRQDVHQRLDAELAVLWRRVRRMAITLAREVDEGLDIAAYTLLSAMHDGGDVRAGDLAERFGMDKSTVSRQIAQMESLRLIERAADPVDGRARLIHITDEGKQRVRQLRDARGRSFRAALEDWPENEVDQLVGLLARLNISLEHPAPQRAESD